MTPTDQPLGGHHYTNEEMHNEEIAHELGEVNVRTVLAAGAALLVVVAVSAALMYGLWIMFEKQAEARDPQTSPRAVTGGKPRGPELLTDERKYLREFREEEQGTLDTYGWVSQSQGIARVPIEAAKKLVVEHGLPVRSGGADDRTLGTNAPAYGESSGGRTIRVIHAVPQAAPAAEPGPQPAPAQHPAPAGQEIKK